MYADEAKTGTKDSGDQFQLLLKDCRAGKIDMVVTKAISRFARNTVTLLETVRELQWSSRLSSYRSGCSTCTSRNGR
ncbi:MAG: recombinase family protein [Oscillospiraceae bacterium]